MLISCKRLLENLWSAPRHRRVAAGGARLGPRLSAASAG
jgi:hypothetical protein